MDIITFPITDQNNQVSSSTRPNYCDFIKRGFQYVPNIVYYDKHGNQVKTTNEFQSKDQLQQSIEDLLSR